MNPHYLEAGSAGYYGCCCCHEQSASGWRWAIGRLEAMRRLPAGRLETVPDCGHLPHVERPEEFVAIMTAFCAEH